MDGIHRTNEMKRYFAIHALCTVATAYSRSRCSRSKNLSERRSQAAVAPARCPPSSLPSMPTLPSLEESMDLLRGQTYWVKEQRSEVPLSLSSRSFFTRSGRRVSNVKRSMLSKLCVFIPVHDNECSYTNEHQILFELKHSVPLQRAFCKSSSVTRP